MPYEGHAGAVSYRGEFEGSHWRFTHCVHNVWTYAYSSGDLTPTFLPLWLSASGEKTAGLIRYDVINEGGVSYISSCTYNRG